MSWYNEQINRINKEIAAKTTKALQKTPLNKINTEMPITLTIKNLNTDADGERLIQGLLELEGITRVKPQVYQKKLTIFYNPLLIGLNTITYKIASLGYYYVQRG